MTRNKKKATQPTMIRTKFRYLQADDKPTPKKELWEIQLEHYIQTEGKPRIFPTPSHMLKACSEYFQWVKENPLYEAKAFAYQGDITIAQVPKMRAMTLAGLRMFVGMSEQTWYNYKEKAGYLEVMAEIEEAIKDQKFVGAAADMLNANIIARDLGLRDSKEITGKGGGPLSFSVVIGDDEDDE
jgi:hypothetical protein